jgi:hypothetical protein
VEAVLGLKHTKDPDVKAVAQINIERAGLNIKMR